MEPLMKRNVYKKLLQSFAIFSLFFIAIFSLSACMPGSRFSVTKQEYKKTTSDGNKSIIITFHSKEDHVIKQETFIRDAIPDDLKGINKENYKSKYNGLYKKYHGIRGISTKIDYSTDDKGKAMIRENILFDYEKINPTDISDLTGELSHGDLSKDKKVSLKKSIETLKADHFEHGYAP
ncbi:DUF1307 domain-containing protein [Lactococcus hircilactis]|uniref:DUF1307 domain-containing protein n=3 Tax=Lactococcus hircilactis TaxID=1494462 RepID=A0A7X2D0S5_9LACT|nr:DUF1307 domain-containing protein [Lactococcus hircilactis]